MMMRKAQTPEAKVPLPKMRAMKLTWAKMASRLMSIMAQ
jgi:hypothetical protein